MGGHSSAGGSPEAVVTRARCYGASVVGSYPSYLELFESGELARRADEAIAALAKCEVCPRNCRVDRLANRAKVCATGRLARVSTYFPHFGEEDCLRGTRGSGTIFFSFCNLKCVFCQNHDTSQAGEGDEVTADGLARMMLYLQGERCHNMMPGLLAEAEEIFRFLASLSPETYVNVMGQYRPEYRAMEFPEIARPPTAREIEAAHELARRAGLHRLDERRTSRFLPLL
jgi:uncharacterized Fe-S radical SAM superfamily protein PflX